MQSETTMRYPYVLIKMAKVRKTAEHTKCEICGGTETLEMTASFLS